MRKLYLTLAATIVCASLCADNIVSVSKAICDKDENVDVTYTGMPASSYLYFYQDAALLPLSWYVNNSTEAPLTGNFPTYGLLEPYANKIRIEQEGAVLDSAMITVREVPFVRKGEEDKAGPVIWLMTDIHVMAPALIINDGKALQDVVESDRKMLRQSAEIFEALTDSILLYKPDILLIAGDLTKDGEKVSHELVAQGLNKMKAEGIEVFVIPGNHDIKNPNAKYFDGDQSKPAEDVLEQEFREIYKDFGYDSEKYQQDTSSLSYIAEPTEGLTIIGIDATRCRENLSTQHGDSKNQRQDYGKLRDETLHWVTDRADEAKAKGNMVIAMMHHQLVEHFADQSVVLASAAIENGDSIADIFIEHGIHLVLTGHMHISNNTTYYNEALTDSLVEISTGATVSYPVPYRSLTIYPETEELVVSTRNLHALKDITDMGVFSRDELSARVDKLMASVANMFSKEIDSALAEAKSQSSDDQMMQVMIEKLESALPKSNSDRALLAYKYFGEPFTLAMLTASEGNEDRKLTELLDPMIETGVDSLMEYIIVAGDFEHTTFTMMGFPITISTVEIVRMMGGVVKLMIEGKSEQIDSYAASLPAGFKNMLEKMKTALEKVDKIKNSMLKDISYPDTDKENKTDDMFLNLRLPGIKNVKTPTSLQTARPTLYPQGWYDVLGRETAAPTESGIYIHNGKVVIK
ncbi:MAG: metallophosphoesterase [Paludibacteraceae bacterium]|nr:metallophosphoesterase [Paludibacteraceae bacterium]